MEGDEDRYGVYRALAGSYIRKNKKAFMPFMNEGITVEEYCDWTEEDGNWGGQIEMNALANALKFNVIIHQVDNPSMAQIFHKPKDKFPVVHLSFHLGEHYNSIRRGDDPLRLKKSPVKRFPIGYDLDKIKKKLVGKSYKKEEKKQTRAKTRLSTTSQPALR